MLNKYAKWLALIFTAFLWTRVTLGADLSETADSNAWLALGHYRPALLGGVKSTVDSKGFFLSPEGKRNPKKELQATLDLFNHTDEEQKKCLFPARYTFLKKQGFDLKPFPVCEEFDKFKKDVKADGLTLLFTDAYMNNPSSLFGHTLLRIDIPEGKTQLIAHGVNYGAFVAPDENGILFVVYGLGGGYWGGFTIKPYYDIINTYNNIENRDIWEYKLNIHGEELSFFIEHLWEVGNAQTKYFFISENCSYMLMEVLDAVRPSLQLSDDFPMQTIPMDTLKAVQKRPVFVEKVVYRPSRQKRIQNRFDRLTQEEQKILLAFLKEQKDDLLEMQNPQRQSEILQTAYEWTQYQRTKEKISLKEYRTKSFDILNRLSKLPPAEKEIWATPPDPVSVTHESMRLSTAFGRRQGKTFEEISFRPAYHSLTDKNDGFLNGAQLNFLDFQMRYYNLEHKTVFQGTTLLDLRSLAPRNQLFSPVSYQVRFGVYRELNNKTKEEGYLADLSAGFGTTYDLGKNTSFFLFGNGYGKYGGFMPDNAGIGIGPMVGFLSHFGNVHCLFQAEHILSTNRYLKQTNASAEISYALTKNTSIAFLYDYTHNMHHSINEYKSAFRIHF